MESNGEENLVVDSNANNVVTYDHALTEEEIEDIFSASNENSYIELSKEEGKALNDLIINHPEIKWWWFSENAIYLEINYEAWDELWK